MKIVYLLLIIAVLSVTGYFVFKSRDFRKFLAGAFFVSGGIQLYLAFANVSIPVLGTDIVQDAQLGYARGALHLTLFLVFLYFGFIKPSKHPQSS